jgi:hypothetical protein
LSERADKLIGGNEMKTHLAVFGAAWLLVAAPAAFADSECQKCTHDMQVKYRECRQKGRDPDTCSKEQQAAAQACVVTCQARKPPDEKRG